MAHGPHHGDGPGQEVRVHRLGQLRGHRLEHGALDGGHGDPVVRHHAGGHRVREREVEDAGAELLAVHAHQLVAAPLAAEAFGCGRHVEGPLAGDLAPERARKRLLGRPGQVVRLVGHRQAEPAAGGHQHLVGLVRGEHQARSGAGHELAHLVGVGGGGQAELAGVRAHRQAGHLGPARLAGPHVGRLSHQGEGGQEHHHSLGVHRRRRPHGHVRLARGGGHGDLTAPAIPRALAMAPTASSWWGQGLRGAGRGVVTSGGSVSSSRHARYASSPVAAMRPALRKTTRRHLRPLPDVPPHHPSRSQW